MTTSLSDSVTGLPALSGRAWRRRAHRQRGAAALVITLVLFFVMLIAAAYVNRNLVFEQRSSANQYRATQAFEAAEAGLEWAAAQLNSDQRIGSDCLAAAAPAVSFRDRFVAHDPATGRFAGRTSAGGSPVALEAACVRTPAGWSCACPGDGAPALVVPAGDAVSPAFSVRFLGGDKPGSVRVVSLGCTSLAAPCVRGTADAADASATVQVAFALLPALVSAPVAALTVRGSVDAGNASIGAHNASGIGIAIHAGGAIAAPLARLSAAAGGVASEALVDADAALAALAPERFFAAYFGLDKLAWKLQPGVRRIACTTNCAGVVGAAIDAYPANPMLWVTPPAGASARIDGPVSFGSVANPVAIVVDGPLQIAGAVVVHGVLYARSLRWTDQATPGVAAVRGAVLVEGDYTGDAAADFVYDAQVLSALKQTTGSFVRVNGSWRDY